jgi:nitroreductase
LDSSLTHKSVEKNTEKGVPKDMLQSLLKAAMSAHSADDERPWHFIVIKDQSVLEQISKIQKLAYMVAQAPAAIIVCGDKTLQKHRGFWIQDCAAATQNLLIDANKLKINATWEGIYPIEGRIQQYSKLLKTPEYVIPFSLVVLGFAVEYRVSGNKFDKKRIHYDRW